MGSIEIEQLPVVKDGSHFTADDQLRPNTWYQAGEHDYIYHTDANGHIDRWIAEDLQLKVHDGRLVHDPNTPGKLPGDHAGHLAGDQFGGSPKLDNLVSQLSDINLSKFKKLENQWASALKSDPPVGSAWTYESKPTPPDAPPRSRSIPQSTASR
ncbi:MAG: DNA/RNA non-specific endonuclease [Microbacterium sp.]